MTRRALSVAVGTKEPCPRCRGSGYIIRKRQSHPHGTAGRYFQLGCRCKWCKAAGSIYNAAINAARRTGKR
jgi:hypothetical protein